MGCEEKRGIHNDTKDSALVMYRITGELTTRFYGSFSLILNALMSGMVVTTVRVVPWSPAVMGMLNLTLVKISDLRTIKHKMDSNFTCKLFVGTIRIAGTHILPLGEEPNSMSVCDPENVISVNQHVLAFSRKR